MKQYKLILASNSPRRKQLLGGIGYPFDVKVFPDLDETYPESLPVYEVAQYIANKKAEAYKDLLADDTVIITADTVVIAPTATETNDLEGEGIILGKPKNHVQAKEMLSMLSGKTHHVVTGVCLSTLHEKRLFSVTTEVSFKTLTEDEIDYYIRNYQPYDKAGAYGIQEWIGYVGCTGIKGSYYNVMGLPVQRIYEELQTL